MADEQNLNTPAEPIQQPDPQNDEVLKERKRANDAYAALRKRDAEYRRDIEDLRQKISSMEQTRSTPQRATGGDDPEPDPEQEPMKWFQWRDRQRDKAFQAELQRRDQMQAQQGQFAAMQNFALSSEAAARQQVPDYDNHLAFLRESYRKEMEDTGELPDAASRGLADPNYRQIILNRAAEKGLSEYDAALDWAADLAWEIRRQNIVSISQRTGANPALKAVQMAKRRGYGNQAIMGDLGFKPLSGQPGTHTTGAFVEDGLKELERRKNLRAGTNTTADIKDGGEVQERRAWKRGELEELRTTNPKAYRQAIQDIANMADEGDTGYRGIITR